MILFCEEKDANLVDKQITDSFEKLMNVMVAKEIKNLPPGQLKNDLEPKANAWIEALSNESIHIFKDIRDIDDLIRMLDDNEDFTILAIKKAYSILSKNHAILSKQIKRDSEFEKLMSRVKMRGMNSSILKANAEGIISQDAQTQNLRTIYKIVLIGYNGLKSKGKIA